MPQNRVTINTRVDPDYAAAVYYFASREHMSAATYLRTALSRRAAETIKTKYAEHDRLREVAVLMQGALDNGTWEKLSADQPDIYPSTRAEWEARITAYESSVEKIRTEIEEMDKKVKAMGVAVLA